MNKQYNFERDVKFLTGRGALRNATIIMSNMGCRKVLLICDEESNSSGKYKKVLRKFNREVNIVAEYKKVKEIAACEDCENALRLYKEGDCDSIIAIGDKSAIFVAKAVKIMLKDNVSIMSNYLSCAVNSISSLFLPLIVIPTYLSSGVETSNYIRLSMQDGKIIELDTPFAHTNVVTLDPCLCGKSRAKEIASSGLCTLAMAITSLLRNDDANTMVKVYALNAITLLTDNFKESVIKKYSVKRRFKIALAAILAGCAYWHSPHMVLTKLTNAICDVSGANFNDVFNLLFAKGVMVVDLTADFDMYTIVNLIGENEYVDLTGEKSSEQIIKNSVKKYYSELCKYVKYPRTLEDLDVTDEMLGKVMEDMSAQYDGKSLELIKKIIGK